jgi:ABC-type uncharacterized transport system permease subunit
MWKNIKGRCYSLSSTLPHASAVLTVLCMARCHISTISAVTSLTSCCSGTKVHLGDTLNGLISQWKATEGDGGWKVRQNSTAAVKLCYSPSDVLNKKRTDGVGIYSHTVGYISHMMSIAQTQHTLPSFFISINWASLSDDIKKLLLSESDSSSFSSRLSCKTNHIHAKIILYWKHCTAIQQLCALSL